MKTLSHNRLGLGIAALAVATSSLAFVGGAQTANASVSATCDASHLTVTVRDAVTNELVTNASTQIYGNGTAAGTAGLLVDNQMAQEGAFKAGFLTAPADFYATPIGVLIENTYQESLGTTKPAYPSDITEILEGNGGTGNVTPAKTSARNQWQADGDGRIAALEADIQRRLDAMDAALAFNGGAWETSDQQLWDHIELQQSKLNALKNNLNTAKTTTDQAAFVAAYDFVVAHANWSYGATDNPSVQFQDETTNFVWTAGQVAGATAVSVVQETNQNVDGAGEVDFTVFGVKDIYADRNTRGDDTCSQLGSTVGVTRAPGYVLDGAVYTLNADSDATGELTIFLNPEDNQDPTVPPRTDTGL